MMTLPKPPEPDRYKLVSRVDTKSSDQFLGESTGETWKLKIAVPSYLWNEYWKEPLEAEGTTWPEFQAITPTWAIEAWSNDVESWEYVLQWYQDSLGVEIE